jgi:hypothetical protein
VEDKAPLWRENTSLTGADNGVIVFSFAAWEFPQLVILTAMLTEQVIQRIIFVVYVMAFYLFFI